MDTNPHIEAQIQQYIDGTCTPAEQEAIARRIAQEPAWANAHREALAIHQLLQQHMEPMEPSLRFSKNIMEQIATLPLPGQKKRYLHPWMVGSIAATLLIMLLVVLGMQVAQTGAEELTGTSTLPLPQVSLPTWDWQQLLSGRSAMLLMLLHTVLGFALLDKWLRSRRPHSTASR